MRPSNRTGWQRVLGPVLVCAVVGMLLFLGRWIFRAQEESATLGAAQRLVIILEDHRSKHGHFPPSLTELFVDSASSSNNRPPQVLERFDYRSDGRSYELRFVAGEPMVLNRKEGAPGPGKSGN